VNKNERIFIENFLAIGYFRIPEFRNDLIKIFEGIEVGVEIEEWRGTEYSLDVILE
jgi:hypothetical protein